MAGPLKLEVHMSMVDRVLAPMRSIDRQAKDSADSLRAMRETTSNLNKQLGDIRGYHRMTKEQKALQVTQTTLQDKLKASNAKLDEQRAAYTNISASAKVSRIAHDKLVQSYQDGKIESGAYIRQLELTRITMLRASQTQEKALAAMRRQKESIKGTEQELGKLKTRQNEAAASLRGYAGRLNEAGIGTDGLAAKLRQIGRQWKSGKTAIDQQREAVAKLADQQRKLSALRESHNKAMTRTAVMAGAGVAGVMTGRAVAAPVRTSLGAYGEQENAATQLRASMMQADGSVPQDFQKISDLATRLGDKLPGTTAEFQEMMTMLRRQGLSAQTILGGTGEAAALLGVQLRMPVTEAAEFAAKMQDATRTTEGDMLGLMDTIQRTFYLGVDSGNMLQGFTKLSPVMGIIKKEGLEASKMLAPLLVMMDQTGMAGESAGNAIRKVFQSGLDAKKLDKANEALKSMKAGFQVDFTDGKGNFAGIDKVFEQVQKIGTIKDDVKRTGIIKALFGDDAETLQVVDTFMSKGIAGYNEVAAKMQAQADLRKRVDMQLGTLSNVVEAAQGTWTNVLASISETVAPDAKSLVGWLGEMASAVGAWVKANPTLVAWLVKAAAAVAVLYVAIGGLMIALAGVLAPMLMVRFALASLGVQGGLLSLVLRGVAAAVRFVGGAIMGVVRLLLANPIIAIVAGIAAAAYLIYRNWGAIAGFFAGLWASIKAGAASAWQQLGGSFPAVLATIAAAIVNWSPVGLFYRAFAGVLSYFGIELPAAFTRFGANIIQGLVKGITNSVALVKNAVGAAADSTVGWFKEKLGIRSPSRVFMAAGVNVGEGAALGIDSTRGMISRAALGMVAATAVTLPAPAMAVPAPKVPQSIAAYAAPTVLPELLQRVAMIAPQDSPAIAAMPALAKPQTLAPISQAAPAAQARAPRAAQPAPAAAGDRIEIHVHAAPGMDARAIATAVRAELDRRDADKRARAAGSFYDLNN